TVGNVGGVGLDNFDQIVIDAERLRSNLTKDRVRALPNFRAGRENLDASFDCRFRADNRLQIYFTRTGETCAVHERREADAFQVAQIANLRYSVLLREPLSLHMIIR